MSCPSQLRLDEWLAGIHADEIGAHLSGCARCATRLAALEVERAAFAARSRPRAFAEAVLARRRPVLSRWTLGVATVLAACALLLLVRPRDLGDPSQGYKGGGPDALLLVQRGEQVAAYDAGRKLRAGDRVQVVVLSTRMVHVAVVDVEDGGAATLLYHSDRPLRPGRTPLPRSFELDAWPGGEDFVVLFADQPIDDAIARAKRGEGRRFFIPR